MRNELEWLSSKKIYSTFDLRDAFYKMEVEEDSKPMNEI